MFGDLARITCALVAVSLLAGSVAAASHTTFEGRVKDPKGYLIRGAEVRLLRSDKVISKVKTDADGRYSVRAPMSAGVYQIDLLVNATVVARFENVKADVAGSKRMNFDLKYSPRRLWVIDTGTRLGRWVDLDDPASITPAQQQLYRGDVDWFRRMQDRTAGAMGR